MPILGLRHTANFVANQRPENWRETIMLMYPTSAEAAKAPLTALTSVMKKRSTDDPVFHWWEKALNNRRFLLTADLGAVAAGTGGNLTVDATYNPATGVKKNDVLYVEQTGEIMRVSADPTATNTIPVIRGANTGGAGLAVTVAGAGVNPYVMVIGSAFEEGSDAPTGVNFDPNERNNYTQIFRSTLEMTRTAQRTRLRTGDAVAEAKRECLEYYSVDIERAFWFGKKASTTLNGKPLRMMSGLIQQIETGSSANIITANAGAGEDMDWLMNFLKVVFQDGSPEKMAFMGNQAFLTITEIVRKNSTLNIESGIKEYGMAISRLNSGFGTLAMKAHPLFNQQSGGENGGAAFYGMDSAMVILDMQYLKYVYLDDIKYEADLAQTGLDGIKSGYLGEISLELGHPKAHFFVKNLAKATKDA